MRVLMVLVMFLLFGLFFIVSNQGLKLGVEEDRVALGRAYYSWAENLFDGGVEVTGYVVNSEWIPSNKSSDKIIRD